MSFIDRRELDHLPDGDFPWMSDPRDIVLASFDYLHPHSTSVSTMAGGWFDLPHAIAQLVIAELLEGDFLLQHDDYSLGLTEKGGELIKGRLYNREGWAEYCVRPDAVPNPPMGVRLGLAMLNYKDEQIEQYKLSEAHFADLSLQLNRLFPGLYKNAKGHWVTDE